MVDKIMQYYREEERKLRDKAVHASRTGHHDLAEHYRRMATELSRINSGAQTVIEKEVVNA